MVVEWIGPALTAFRHRADFFRLEAAPVCAALEDFAWNKKVEASKIDPATRDAYTPRGWNWPIS